MKTMRHAGAVAIVLAMLLASSLRAQVLKSVPGDALLAIKISNLQQTSDKVKKLAEDLGIAAMVPQFADPIAAIQEQTNIRQGLDLAGELAFVFMDPAHTGGDPDDAFLVLVPVSDYAAFLTNFAGAKTEGAVTEVEIGRTTFIANWGKYAAIGVNKDAIAKQPSGPGLSIPALSAKEIAGKDAILYANFAALRTKLVPQLQEHRPQLVAMMEDALKNEPAAAKFVPVLKAALNQALNVAEEFLNDADAATVGISIAPEGINSTVMAEFKSGSYIANTVSAMNAKNTDAPLLAGLPEGKYLFYGGGVSDPAVNSKLVSDLIDPIVKELAAVGPEGKAIEDYVATIKTYIASQKGQNFGVLAPTGAIGAEPLLQFISVQSGDAQSMAASYTKMIDQQTQVMKSFNVPGTAAITPTHTARAKTLDGVTFDTIVTKVDMNAQDPQAMQQAQIMNMMYGPQGAVVNYGVVGDKLLTVSGVSDAVVSSAIAAVKANSAPLAGLERVKAVAAQLPKQRLAVIYVPVDEIATTVLNYARQFGAGMNVQLPPDLPPVGVTVATQGTAMRVDSHIPTTLIQSMVAAGMQAAMQMGGGGPRGGGL